MTEEGGTVTRWLPHTSTRVHLTFRTSEVGCRLTIIRTLGGSTIGIHLMMSEGYSPFT